MIVGTSKKLIFQELIESYAAEVDRVDKWKKSRALRGFLLPATFVTEFGFNGEFARDIVTSGVFCGGEIN